MSLRNKLAEVRAHATGVERGRALWCLDQIMDDLKADLEKKILVESDRHFIEVKISIFRMLAKLAKIKIISGDSPK